MRRGHLFSARRWRWALLYNLWGTTCKIFQKSGSPINVFSIYSYSPATSNGNKLLAILRFCRDNHSACSGSVRPRPVRDNAAFITLLWFVIRPRQWGSEHLIIVSSIHTFQMQPFLCWAMNRAWNEGLRKFHNQGEGHNSTWAWLKVPTLLVLSHLRIH